MVPIVLPHLVVRVDANDQISVTLDGARVTGEPIGRHALGGLIEEVLRRRKAPLRVEIIEHDGTTYTDVLTPPAPIAAPAAAPETEASARRGEMPVLYEATGDGYVPGEDVALAVVIRHSSADGHGHVRHLIEERELATGGEVLLFGRISRHRSRRRGPGMNPHQPSQVLANLGLAALAGFAVLAGLLRAAGSAAAFLTGLPQPAGGPSTGLGVLLTPAAPGEAIGAPGLSPVVYWLVLAIALAILGVIAWWAWRVIARGKETRAQDPRLLQGIATARDVAKAAGTKALTKRAGTFRPSLEDPAPEDVGYLLGRSKGQEVWATVEDSILLIGPPRSGKGLHVVINAILDAPRRRHHDLHPARQPHRDAEGPTACRAGRGVRSAASR